MSSECGYVAKSGVAPPQKCEKLGAGGQRQKESVEMSKISVTIDGYTYDIQVNLHQRSNSAMTVTVNGEELQVTVPDTGDPENMEWIIVGNRPYEIVVDRNLRWIKSYSGMHPLEIRDRETAVSRPMSRDGRVKAPIPGMVTRVLVEPGDQVKAGQPLLVLEAMKMENEIRAPRSGVVGELNVRQGQDVRLNTIMLEITDPI
jgi:biotin carboxyl carrier protein